MRARHRRFIVQRLSPAHLSVYASVRTAPTVRARARANDLADIVSDGGGGGCGGDARAHRDNCVSTSKRTHSEHRPRQRAQMRTVQRRQGRRRSRSVRTNTATAAATAASVAQDFQNTRAPLAR